MSEDLKRVHKPQGSFLENLGPSNLNESGFYNFLCAGIFYNIPGSKQNSADAT